MQITGSYLNYSTLTNLLSPLGVKDSSDLVMQVFSSSLAGLQDKIDKELFSKESQVAIQQLYSHVADLGAKASKLTTTDMDAVFFDRAAASSDAEVLTATAMDAFSEDSGATEATYQISVTQLAQAQKNTGLELNGTDSSVIGAGTHTINIHADGQDHEINIAVEEGDTNADVFQKMADAINEAGLTVNADVNAGSEEGSQRLVLTSEGTGAANAFTVSDVSGNAVTALGADNVTTVAQDAVYTVDDTDYTSETNTVYLDDGLVSVTLKGAGESTLTVAPDPGKVQTAITNLVTEVNTVLDFLKENDDYITDDIASEINAIIDGHGNQLESLGITRDEEGALVIDSEALASSVSENPSGVKETMAGLDGVAVQLDTMASKISTDSPLNYTEEADGMNADYADYLYDTSAQMMQEILVGSIVSTYI